MARIRLQKYLAQAGICSRRKGEAHIQAGLVKVNGAIVTELGTKIDPEIDRVEFKNKAVKVQQELIYVVLNKPSGYVTSCRKHKDPIVLDLVPLDERVYPVGRLDKNSDGLVMLTNDGRLHQRLSHPSFDHEKEYLVTTVKPIRDADLNQMAEGVLLDGRRTRPAVVGRVTEREFRITLKEGRNRQIRRMVDQVGNRVKRLTRVRISRIRLGSLPVGHWRYLTDSELAGLQAEVINAPSKKTRRVITRPRKPG